jgi:type I restriction enzyme S subunit
VKLADPEIPVRFTWLTEQGFRLDPRPYLSGAYQARKLLERLPVRKDPLRDVTSGFNGGIFNGPQFRRVYVNDREYGVPFLGSTDMLEADFSWLPFLSRKDAKKLPYLEVREGMSLISCSGTVGRMTYARPDMNGFWSSQHVMKVVPNPEKIRSGYLHAFLLSRYGAPIITGSAYGAIVQHIEPHHIENLEIPRLGEVVESRIHDLIQEAAQLRTSFQAGVVAATEDLFTSADLTELIDLQWHKQPRSLGFSASLSTSSLRALNYDVRVRRIIKSVKYRPHETLANICSRGELSRGLRFKRIESDKGYGVPLLGQRQAFWVRPEEKWISLSVSEIERIRAQDETTLVASQGLLTENALIGRAILAIGDWRERFGFSEHFLRIRPGRPDVPGAYLFAFLRSEASFRMMRSLCAGTGPQDINAELRKELPVPLCTPADRERIAERVRRAYRERDLADDKVDEALRLLDEAVREAAR